MFLSFLYFFYFISCLVAKVVQRGLWFVVCVFCAFVAREVCIERKLRSLVEHWCEGWCESLRGSTRVPADCRCLELTRGGRYLYSTVSCLCWALVLVRFWLIFEVFFRTRKNSTTTKGSYLWDLIEREEGLVFVRDEEFLRGKASWFVAWRIDSSPKITILYLSRPSSCTNTEYTAIYNQWQRRYLAHRRLRSYLRDIIVLRRKGQPSRSITRPYIYIPRPPLSKPQNGRQILHALLVPSSSDFTFRQNNERCSP